MRSVPCIHSIRFHWNWFGVWEARGSRAGAEDRLLQCERVHTAAHWPASGEGEGAFPALTSAKYDLCIIFMVTAVTVWGLKFRFDTQNGAVVPPLATVGQSNLTIVWMLAYPCSDLHYVKSIFYSHLSNDHLHILVIVQDIVPVDASYEVKELYVQENKLDLAKADAETLPAVQIGKVPVTCDINTSSCKVEWCKSSALCTSWINKCL